MPCFLPMWLIAANFVMLSLRSPGLLCDVILVAIAWITLRCYPCSHSLDYFAMLSLGL